MKKLEGISRNNTLKSSLETGTFHKNEDETRIEDTMKAIFGSVTRSIFKNFISDKSQRGLSIYRTVHSYSAVIGSGSSSL